MSFFEILHLEHSPSGSSGVNATQQTKVLVIGGGYSGIGTAIRLNQAGIDDYILIEKAAKLGGTWRENTYPMAGADTPSIIYSFSYARNPDWDYTFALQPQIEKYLDDVADRFDVSRARPVQHRRRDGRVGRRRQAVDRADQPRHDHRQVRDHLRRPDARGRAAESARR